jgi:hypothetical protein
MLTAEDSTHFLAGALPLPAPVDLDEVLAALRLLVERHESLRTLFDEQDGIPAQHVLGKGEIDVEIIESGCEPDEAVKRTQATLVGRPFDGTRDLPFRAGVVLSAGDPRFVVLAVSHLAVDGWSFKIVCEELTVILTSRGELPPTAQQPVDRVRYEASGSAQRFARSALAHWEAGFRQAPQFWLSGFKDEGEGIEWLQMSSQRLATALTKLERLTRLTPAMILQAAVALRLCMLHGASQAALRLLVSPRFRPESRNLVGPFNQQALLRFEVINESFVDFLKRAGTASLLAYARCEYDPCAWDELFVAVHAQRGITNTSGCTFNDARIDRGPADVIPLEQAAAAEIVPLDLNQQTGVKFFLFLLEVGQVAQLRLAVDPRFLSGPEFMLGLEAMLVAGLEPGITTSQLAEIGDRTTLGLRT